MVREEIVPKLFAAGGWRLASGVWRLALRG
jgi:hypothetical protein